MVPRRDEDPLPRQPLRARQGEDRTRYHEAGRLSTQLHLVQEPRGSPARLGIGSLSRLATARASLVPSSDIPAHPACVPSRVRFRAPMQPLMPSATCTRISRWRGVRLPPWLAFGVRRAATRKACWRWGSSRVRVALPPHMNESLKRVALRTSRPGSQNPGEFSLDALCLMPTEGGSLQP